MKPVVIQPGTLLQNRYRVSEQVGKGGMGEVYLATDERFQSRVAIKRTFYDDAEMRKAFAREARLLNRLRHPSLPQVSDHFTEGDSQFLVMEFIEGYDLGELLKRRKVAFPLAEVLRWADELLEVLDYLHHQDPPVVHRDIKPANIKLTPDGRVVLLDFGLAKGMKSQTDAGTASSIFGYSLSFAPLEQMQGSGTDPRSDIYSVAATLYFLLTAVRPIDALTRAAATVKHQPDPLRPSHMLQAQVTKEVSQILQRAMSQNSALRHASAVELRAALRQAANQASSNNALPKPATENVPDVSLSVKASAPSSNSKSFIVIDSSRRPLSYDAHTTSTRDTSSTLTRLAARPKLLFIVSLLFVSAAAAAYMIAGASSTRTHAATTSTEAQAASTLDQQSGAIDADDFASSEPLVESSNPAPSSTVSSQPARTVGETASNSQDAASPANGNTASNEKSASAAVTGNNNSAASAQPVNKPALVIQQPAPAANPSNETRRAEEPARTQPAYPSEDTNRPPPPYPPPPPADRRPPPPDRRWPPPPLRRP